ncbi:MAG: hypothetical protein N3J91_02365 [Verrucomicrobiae bacterium]|nr:hypothetical protein [Verrucomicrobiae bacterium]
MISPDQLWRRLTAAARQAPTTSPELSGGHVSRIVSRWQAEQEEEAATVEVMAWMGRRVLLSAVVVMTAVLALSYLPWDDTWTALSGSAPWLEVVADL